MSAQYFLICCSLALPLVTVTMAGGSASAAAGGVCCFFPLSATRKAYWSCSSCCTNTICPCCASSWFRSFNLAGRASSRILASWLRFIVSVPVFFTECYDGCSHSGEVCFLMPRCALGLERGLCDLVPERGSLSGYRPPTVWCPYDGWRFELGGARRYRQAAAPSVVGALESFKSLQPVVLAVEGLSSRMAPGWPSSSPVGRTRNPRRLRSRRSLHRLPAR